MHEKANSAAALVNMPPFDGEPTPDQVDLCRERGTSPASARTQSSSSDILTGSEHDLIDEDANEEQGVVESKIRLLPACWKYHGHLAKGKARENKPDTSPHTAYRCGDQELCFQHILLPPSAAGTSHRLITASPEEDLKRWLLTPNDTLDGTNEERKRDFVLNDARYDGAIISSALDLAMSQTRAEMAHIESLLSYAARQPYKLSFRFNDDLSSFSDREVATKGSMQGSEADREKLGTELVCAVKDFDFLRERAAWVSGQILRCKVERAREGDWAEIGWLLEMGVVDEWWVGEECVV